MNPTAITTLVDYLRPKTHCDAPNFLHLGTLLCILPRSRIEVIAHNLDDITVTVIGGHIDQTLHYINMHRNNTSGPYCQEKPTIGNMPNLQSHQ
jgi:hypothetical protein